MRLAGRFPLLLALAAGLAHAQVTLDFEDLSGTLADYGIVPASYGSTLDPNLASISYRTFTASDNSTLTNYVEFWHKDYGDLSNVVFASSNGYAAEVKLVPAAGYGIRIVSFDIAGWANVDRTDTIMRLVDGNGSTLLDFTNGTASIGIEGDFTGPRHSSFTHDYTYYGTIALQWGNDWDVGLDNFRFQLVAIPEPATTAMLAGLIASACVAWLPRRSARVSPLRS